MNDLSENSPEVTSVEEMVGASLRNAKAGIRRRYLACEDRIRKSPTASIVGATAVGYLLHRMPVRAIIVTHVRVLSALTPPALFFFGAAKLYDYLQKKK